MLLEVWAFLKNPENKLLDTNLAIKRRRFSGLLFLAVSFSILSGIFLQNLSILFNLDIGTHAADRLLKQFSTSGIFFIAVVLAPLLEELVFRAPLVLFKEPKTFRYAFYGSVLIFGSVHISNFEAINGHFWAIPFLVLPQLCAGVFLGFIRIRHGLLWSILLHALHNLVLIGPMITVKLFDIPTE